MEDLSIRAKALFLEELSMLRSIRKSGVKTAALVCRSFPTAILAGLGLRPVRIPLQVSEKAKSPGGTLSREDVCPLVKELLRELETDCVDLVIGMHSCDMTRRFFQESNRFTDIQVHQIQLPCTPGEASLAFFTEQVERLCKDIALNGFSDGYNIERAEEWYRGTMKAAAYLRSKMMTIPPVALQYMFHLFRIADPSTLTGKLRQLIEDAEQYKPAFTILLSGSPVIPGDDTAAEIIESLGGALVPVNCTGFQMFPDRLPGDFSPHEIVRQYFDSMKCIRCRPNRKTFSHLEEELSKTSAHALIIKSLVFCDLWFTEKVRMKESFNVPVLVLDSSFAKGERERTAVRIEGLVQSLETK